jgi:hypothetical protein
VCGFRLRTNYTPEQQAIANRTLDDAVWAEVGSTPPANRTAAVPSALQRQFGPLTLGNAAVLGAAGVEFNAPNASLTLLPVGGNARGSPAPNSSSSSVNAGQGGYDGSNSSVIDIRGTKEQYVDTGGPSCRPAELVDLGSGVVNYGC